VQAFPKVAKDLPAAEQPEIRSGVPHQIKQQRYGSRDSYAPWPEVGIIKQFSTMRLGSGPRGRRFKSSRPDQFPKKICKISVCRVVLLGASHALPSYDMKLAAEAMLKHEIGVPVRDDGLWQNGCCRMGHRTTPHHYVGAGSSSPVARSVGRAPRNFSGTGLSTRPNSAIGEFAPDRHGRRYASAGTAPSGRRQGSTAGSRYCSWFCGLTALTASVPPAWLSLGP
jgi:hypothetical protein